MTVWLKSVGIDREVKIMDEIPKTDKPFLILQRLAGRSASQLFVGKRALSWLVFGTKGDHSIHAQGKTHEEAWRQAYRKA